MLVIRKGDIFVPHNGCWDNNNEDHMVCLSTRETDREPGCGRTYADFEVIGEINNGHGGAIHSRGEVIENNYVATKDLPLIAHIPRPLVEG